MKGRVLFEDLSVSQDCGCTAFGAQLIPQYADLTDCLSSQMDKLVSGTTRMATSVPTRHFQVSKRVVEKDTGGKKMKLHGMLVWPNLKGQYIPWKHARRQGLLARGLCVRYHHHKLRRGVYLARYCRSHTTARLTNLACRGKHMI